MNNYFRAYSGSKPYIFVSYCHADRSRVYPIISCLHTEGYRIWYDEGITPTEEWRGVINQHIIDCSMFMVFVTENSMNSHEVVKETTFAINLKKRMHIIYLEDVSDRHINASLLADFMNSQRVPAYNTHSSVFDIKLREPLGEFRDIATHDPEPMSVRDIVTAAPVTADHSRDAFVNSVAPELWNDTVRSKAVLSTGVIVSLVVLTIVLAIVISVTGTVVSGLELIDIWPVYLFVFPYPAYVILMLIVSKNAKECTTASSLRDKLKRGRSLLWGSTAVTILSETWIGILLVEAARARYISPDYYSAGTVILFELTSALIGLVGMVLILFPIVTMYYNFSANTKIRMMLKPDVSSLEEYQKTSRFTRRLHKGFTVEAIVFAVVAECIIIINTADSQWFFEDAPRIIEIIYENLMVACFAVPLIVAGIIIRSYYNTLLTFGDRLAESILSGKIA